MTVESRRPRRTTEDDAPIRASSPASFLTTILLGIILVTASSVLGAARLWIELPLLGGITLVLLIQALRLATVPAIGVFRQIDAIDLSVLLFVLYTLGRWLTSPTEYFSRLEAMNVVAYAVIFLTCRYGLSRRTYGLGLVILLVALGVGETAFGYYLSQHSDVNNPQSLWFPFGPTERLQLYYAPRWIGTYGCPNHYGGLLVMALGATMALGCFSRFAWPLRIIFFYVAVVLMVGIRESGSRGSWVALVAAVCGLTFFMLRYSKVRWWVPLTGAVLLIAFFAGLLATSGLVRDRMAEATNVLRMGTLAQYIRVQLAEDALHIAHDYPIFGTGPGTFTFVDPRYQSSTFAFRAELTHDDYLNTLDDYGLVGFALAMFFVFAVTLAFLRPLPEQARWPDRVTMAAGFAAWCALLVHSALDFNLHIPANAMMLFALTGVALRRFPGREAPPHWSTISLSPLGRWLGLSLLLFGLLYGFKVARTGISDYYYEETMADARNVPTIQSIQGVNEALFYDPGNAQALILLGDLYRVRAANRPDMESRITEGQQALDAYQRALKANSLDDTIQARRGLAFDAMRRYTEAFFCYRAALDAEPYDGEFWNALGGFYWERGLLQKAEEAYLMAMQCPYGPGNSAQAAKALRTILENQGLASPAPGTNPLKPLPEAPEVPTTP